MFQNDIVAAEIAVPNFDVFRKDRGTGKEGGGSCIYVHSSLRASLCSSFVANDSIAIAIEADPAPFILVCVYRSQSLTPAENLHMIEQIGKLDVEDGYEL